MVCDSVRSSKEARTFCIALVNIFNCSFLPVTDRQARRLPTGQRAKATAAAAAAAANS